MEIAGGMEREGDGRGWRNRHFDNILFDHLMIVGVKSKGKRLVYNLMVSLLQIETGWWVLCDVTSLNLDPSLM